METSPDEYTRLLIHCGGSPKEFINGYLKWLLKGYVPNLTA